MARSIKTLLSLSVGLWVVVLAAQPSDESQPIAVATDPVRIADFGLEDRIPSAIDLIGPADGSAGRNRAMLVGRLQCWIDGDEACSIRGRNDRRVRAMRRFLGRSESGRHGSVAVHFPDRTRIEVRLTRTPGVGAEDWDRRAYGLEVLPATTQVPGLAAIPSRAEQFDALEYEGPQKVRAALERLKQRLQTADSAPRADAGDVPEHTPALVQGQHR